MGLGCDMIEVDRIEEMIQQYGDTFLKKIFTKEEQAYCAQFQDAPRHYAGYWAAKEAIAKALGVGFGKDLGFLDMVITHDTLGKPLVTLSQEAKERFDNPTLWLSLSHCRSYAMATALVVSFLPSHCKK